MLLTWTEHQHRRGLDLATNPPSKGSGEASQLGCARTLGAPAPLVAWPGPILLWWLHDDMLRRFWPISYFSHAKPSSLHYIWSSFFNTPTFGGSLVVFESKARATWRACLLGRKSNFGMNNTMKSSSIFILSYHLYSSAYELEYSFHVIIMIYELVYSFSDMILTCRTKYLIIYITLGVPS